MFSSSIKNQNQHEKIFIQDILYFIGSNQYSQLGLLFEQLDETSSSPVNFNTLLNPHYQISKINHVSCGYGNSIILCEDSSNESQWVICFGDNRHHQANPFSDSDFLCIEDPSSILQYNESSSSSSSSVTSINISSFGEYFEVLKRVLEIPSLSIYKAEVGSRHSLLLCSDMRTIICFGNKKLLPICNIPTMPEFLTISSWNITFSGIDCEVDIPLEISSIHVGHQHSCLLDSLGGIWSWGKNQKNQLGRRLSTKINNRNSRMSSDLVPSCSFNFHDITDDGNVMIDQISNG